MYCLPLQLQSVLLLVVQKVSSSPNRDFPGSPRALEGPGRPRTVCRERKDSCDVFPVDSDSHKSPWPSILVGIARNSRIFLQILWFAVYSKYKGFHWENLENPKCWPHVFLSPTTCRAASGGLTSGTSRLDTYKKLVGNSFYIFFFMFEIFGPRFWRNPWFTVNGANWSQIQ